MTKDDTTKLKFCYIDDEYLDYLRNPELGDDKVPENEYETRKKFFIDTGFVKNGLRYFAPISSKVKLENNYEFRMLDERGKKYVSAVKLNFMIPVPEGLYERLVMSSLNNNIKYKNLVSLELRFFNDNKIAIQNLVNAVYNLDNPNHEHIIDFIKLEKIAVNFDVKTHTAKKLQEKYKLTDNQISKAQKILNEKSQIDPSLTLDKVICIAIHNDKDNSFDPEVKAMVDKQMQMRILYVKGKPAEPVKTSLQQDKAKDPLQEKYKLTTEQFTAAKELATKENVSLEKIIQKNIIQAPDGIFDAAVKAQVIAQSKAEERAKEQKTETKTQEKIAPKQPKKNNAQNSR